MHYERRRKGRPVGSAAPQRRRIGEGSLQNGYVVIGVNGERRLVHRLLMEQLLGRPLARHETVHHVNGVRHDNRLDGPLVDYRSGNLELWSCWQPSGQRVADKVRWAIEILAMYAPDRLSGGKLN